MCVCQKNPPIDFYKEDITIEIDNRQANVAGRYFFKNLTSVRKRVKFYYPFPVDSIHSYPDTILLDYPYEKDSAGIYFTMTIDANKCDSLKIIYEQKLHKNKFRYITTTTRKWEKPIKEAKFTIIVSEDVSPKINYHIAKEEVVNGEHYYIISISHFYPKEDLMIAW